MHGATATMHPHDCGWGGWLTGVPFCIKVDRLNKKGEKNPINSQSCNNQYYRKLKLSSYMIMIPSYLNKLILVTAYIFSNI